MFRFLKKQSRLVWEKLGAAEQKPAKYFMILGLIFGLIFIFVVPPVQGPDESNHMMRAYQVSEGNLVADYINGYKQNIGFPAAAQPARNVGGSLPEGLVDYTIQAFPIITAQPDKKYNATQFHALTAIKDNGKRANAGFANTTAYSPVSYIPSVPGIWLARIIHERPLVMMYMARVTTLLITIAIITWAIYLLPFAKLPFAIIGLLPNTLMQLSIISADSMALALAYLIIALILKHSFSDKSLKRSDLVLLGSVALLLGLAKPGLFVMTLLGVGLLKNKALKKRRALLIASGIFLVSATAAVWWNAHVKDMTAFGYQTNYEYYNAIFGRGVSYAQQMTYITGHPFSYLRMLYESFLTTGFNTVNVSFIGNFGWLDTPLPDIFVIAGFINIALATFISKHSEKVVLPRMVKINSYIAALIISVFTATSIYLFIIPTKYPNVLGYMQGRYFTPVALLIVVALSSGSKVFSKGRYQALVRKCTSASIVLLGIMLYIIIVRFYNIGTILNNLVHKI